MYIYFSQTSVNMTNNGKYSHIKSFKDFENEKMRLHYQIRLSEKKLELRKFELREYINPIRFFTSFFNDVARPALDLTRSIIMHFLEKNKNKNSNENENSSSKSHKK